MSGLDEQLERLPALLLAHLELTLAALLVATIVSVPLGIVATRVRWVEQVAIGTASVIQTVPGLALLAIMVPLLSMMGASGIGYVPALIGLTLYCVLPILMGTVTGIREVDPAMVEAARGVGMTPGQRLRMVELPLALPVVVSGLRTSTVWCVGMATLSTPVGAPSLGDYIFGGLQTRNYVAVIVGCVAAAILAQVLDRLVQLVEVGIRARRRALSWLGGGALAALYLFTAAAFAAGQLGGGDRPLRIGAKTFTEQYVLSEILAIQIERETDSSTTTVQSLGSTVAFDALVAGDIDAYVDYSGTIWATLMHRGEAPDDRSEVLSEVRDWLEREHGVVVAAALGFENTYALAMRRDRARDLGVRRISDLSAIASELTVGGDFELFSRDEWRDIREVYGLDFAEERTMDPSLMYQAVDQGSVDIIGAYSTDGRIDALDLAVLDDDRGAIPPYDAIVLVSARLARDHPEVVEAIRALDGSIDAASIRRLNARVDRDGETPRRVAESWLQ